MSRLYKTIVAIVFTLALIVAGGILLRFTLPPVVVRAEPLPGVVIGGVQLTNAFITALVVDLLLVVLAFVGTRNMQLVPSGLQNLLEWVVEALYNLTESVATPRWAPRFFAIVATIFLYVLFSNWFGLIPGLAAVGICEEHHIEDAGHAAIPGLAAPLLDHPEEEQRPPLGCHVGEVIVPLFRSPSTDLNNNLALALVSVGMTQVFGVMALGVGYFTKFFNVKGMVRAFGPNERGERRGCAGMVGAFMFGAIDFFVGILELISEFAKIISFSFRLFGNIFAGEVMLLVLASLLPLVLTIPFLGLEVFVGLIQAFIFYILTLAFFTIATVSHDHAEEH
ncbi:MAG: F0F1 ATP synthase subunit A [Anaerolineae bacterium]